MTGDQGVLQYTRALLYHVPKGTKKYVLRAAWREMFPCIEPPGTLAIAVGSLLALLVSMTEHGGEGRDVDAVQSFLAIIDAKFCCAPQPRRRSRVHQPHPRESYISKFWMGRPEDGKLSMGRI